MVKRGDCHFVKKAQNVQNFGAMMMLVIDNKPGENPELHQMADDGRGNKISIPSFMISLGDGKKLIEEIHEE